VRKRFVITLTVMAGSEVWVRVQHATGAFKVPADVSLLEVLQGVSDGWGGTRARVQQGERYIRVPASEWRRLQELEGGAQARPKASAAQDCNRRR